MEVTVPIRGDIRASLRILYLTCLFYRNYVSNEAYVQLWTVEKMIMN